MFKIILKFILALLIAFILTWLIIWFISGEPNIFEWHWLGRTVYLVFSIVSATQILEGMDDFDF
jgi:uncharacterized membrane protein YccC